MGLAESGMTMVCVTHEVGFAREVADRIIFLADGLLVEDTTPAEFFNNPTNERTKKIPIADFALKRKKLLVVGCWLLAAGKR